MYITPEQNKSIGSVKQKYEAVDPMHSNLDEALTGWDQLKQLYERPTMEREAVVRVVRTAFFGGFLVGGASGYKKAKYYYEINNASRKYLNAIDAFKRRTDYAIVRFARGGFGMGLKCAFITGSIIMLSTHFAAYRQHFSLWYFPVFSGAVTTAVHKALVGGVFALPLGMIGSCKAFGFGFSSGLTLSAVTYLYALSIDRSVNDAYWLFKENYEKELLAAEEWERRITELMEAEHIRWRKTAIQRLKHIDEENLASNDT